MHSTKPAMQTIQYCTNKAALRVQFIGTVVLFIHYVYMQNEEQYKKVHIVCTLEHMHKTYSTVLYVQFFTGSQYIIQ